MGQQKKILIVDDEPDILEILSYNLKKEGYDVSTAHNGKAGIKMAKKVRPDLIVLDIMMPKLNGLEVCKVLRDDKRFDDTLIVFLTAREEDQKQISALDIGGDDYIVKPIRPKVLLSRLRALLRRKPDRGDAQNEKLVFGKIAIDFEKMEVLVQGEKVILTKKEFDLLALLTSRPGKVFTRDEIFTAIWRHTIVGGRTIDVHIRKLREKIGDGFVTTVKGAGYKFEL